VVHTAYKENEMLRQYIIVKTDDNRYLSYDEEADDEWFLSHSSSDACRFRDHVEFSKTHSNLKGTLLCRYTEFYIEIIYKIEGE
jgi:hypothetical protein